jgi:hypothetical protein
MRHTLLAAVVMSMLAGCSELTSAGYDYGSIEVKAVSTEGEPISGVRLLLYTGVQHMAYGETGSDGSHEFAFVPHFGTFGVRAQPPAEYLVAEGRGLNFVDGIVIERGGRETIVFTFERNGAVIRVRVVEPSGVGIAGARVVLYDQLQTHAEGFTDSNGELVFSSVPLGNLGVRATPPEGYVMPEGGPPYIDGLQTSPGSEHSLTFTFEPQ